MRDSVDQSPAPTLERGPTGTTLWRWVPTNAERIASDALWGYMAEEYIVEECPDAPGHIVLWGLYHGRWVANPWGTREPIARLLAEVSSLRSGNLALAERLAAASACLGRAAERGKVCAKCGEELKP